MLVVQRAQRTTSNVGRTAALEILKNRANTFYDPMLVANFLRVVGETPAAAVGQ